MWKDEKATTAEGNTNNTPTATADESGTGYAYDGQFVDKEDGLERFGARWYDPDLGLWISTDPILDQEIGGTTDAGKANGGITNPANLGLYTFALNNPITGKDPTGNFTLTPRESGILQASTSAAGVVGSGLLFAGGAAACPFTLGAGCGAAAIGAAGLAYNADNLTAGLATIAANDEAPTLGGAAIASSTHISSEHGELVYAGVGLALGGGELAASARSGEAAAARIPFRGGCSFAAGTEVPTPTGYKTIEGLKVGDVVLSRNEMTGEVAAKPILQVFVNPHQGDIRVLTLSDMDGHQEAIKTSDNHPFHKGQSWVKANELQLGDRIDSLDGRTLAVVGIDRNDPANAAGSTMPVMMWNFEIADFHTYAVSHEQAWVHNAVGPCALNGLRSPIFADNNVLVSAFEGGSNALSEIRAGRTYITPNQYREFLDVKEASARARFLKAEGVEIFGGANARQAASGEKFRYIFRRTLKQGHGRGDAALGAFAGETNYEAVTMERKLVKFYSDTYRGPEVPIRRIFK